MDFDSLAKSFFDLFQRIPNFHTLELLYPLLREEVSAYEEELKFSIGKFMQGLVYDSFESVFAKILEMFLDGNCDKGIGDNLR